MDFHQGFNNLVLNWVFKVMVCMGVDVKVINRLKRIYEKNFTIVSLNNILGKPILNTRMSLCQGDIPSMFSSVFPLILFSTL